MNIQKCVRLSSFTAFAIVLSIFESFIPIFNIPGIKIGLANIIVVSVLYLYNGKDALYVSILRVIVVGILRTGLFSTTFLFSITGALFSLIMMIVLKKLNLFSIIGISIVGSIAHSVGQIIMASILLKNSSVYYYLPILIVLSIVTGIFVGIISKGIIKYLKESEEER